MGFSIKLSGMSLNTNRGIHFEKRETGQSDLGLYKLRIMENSFADDAIELSVNSECTKYSLFEMS